LRVLIEVLPGIAEGLQFALDHIGTLNTSENTEPHTWRQVQCIYGDPSDPDNANKAIFTIDIANITGGKVDSSWTDADYATVEGHLGFLTEQLLSIQAIRCHPLERRYYVRQFNPMSNVHPFAHSGPPERVFAESGVGTGGGALPPQCAISVTEKTAYPRHWGRFYIPFPGAAHVSTQGRVDAAAVTSIAAAVLGAYQGLQNAEFFPVVPVTQVDKVPTRGLLSVNAVQVDDVFDVIRRRRSHTATIRNVQPVAATQPA